MSEILYICTLVLNFSAVVFAAIYIWLNVFTRLSDLAERNKSILHITRQAVVMSFVFGLLSCLLSDNRDVLEAIERTSSLYNTVAISWLVVLLGCGIAMAVAFLSRSRLKADLSRTVGKVFVIALWAAIAAMVLSWLFS